MDIVLTSRFSNGGAPSWAFFAEGIEDPIFEIYELGNGYLVLGLLPTGGYQRKVVDSIAKAKRAALSPSWTRGIRIIKGTPDASVVIL